MSFRHRVRAVLTHPFTQLLVGFCMVGTGLSELIEALDSAVEGFSFSSAHGVILYGMVQSSKALVELLEGLEKVEERAEAKVTASGE